MRPLYIDFAPSSPWQVLSRTPRWGWAGCLAGLALCSALGVRWASLAEQRAVVSNAVAQAEARGLKLQASAKQASRPALSETQIATMNGIVAQLNLPWRDLLEALEDATPANVALIGLEPDARKHVLKVTAEARTDADMVSYIEQLKGQHAFEGVRLTQHEVNPKDPQRAFRFQLEAAWK